MQRCQASVRAKQGEIQGYRKQGLNKAQMFGGEKIPRLVAEIQANWSKFRKLPLGPLGAHIELAPGVNEAKAKLIDKELSQILNNFLVDNFADRKQLEAMAARCGIRDLKVIACEFSDEVYDVSEGR